MDSGVIVGSFGVHLGTTLHHFRALISDRFSKYFFNGFWVHLEIHFGTILASEIDPGRTRKRKRSTLDFEQLSYENPAF